MKITKQATIRATGQIKFTVQWDIDDLRALNDNDLAEFIHEAAVNVCCRTLKHGDDENKDSRAAKIAGKTLDVAATLEWLKATSTRSTGEPSEADVKKASAKHAVYYAAAQLALPDATAPTLASCNNDETEFKAATSEWEAKADERNDAVKTARRAHIREAISGWIKRINVECPGLLFESNSADSNAQTLSKLYRAHRLWQNRQSLPE